MSTSRRVLIVGGGSGGHISPGLAVAEVLAEEGGACTFLCSDREVDQVMLSAHPVDYEPLPAAPLIVRPRGLARCVTGLARSSKRVRRILKSTDFDCVLALGGFVSAAALPGIISSRRRPDGRRRPLVLLNLDRIPGKANRRIAAYADLTLSAVETVSPGFTAKVTGLPVRREARVDRSAAECRRALGLSPERPVVFITGASQGASSLNRLMVRLLEGGWLRDHRDALQLIHLTGRGHHDTLKQQYATAGVRAVVMPFLDHMGLAWGAATVAISRAGANSVGEIQINSVPTIFLPYPHHRDRHQYQNAQPLVTQGGAMILEDRDDTATARTVSERLDMILADPTREAAMRDALQVGARPEAAREVAACLKEA